MSAFISYLRTQIEELLVLVDSTDLFVEYINMTDDTPLLRQFYQKLHASWVVRNTKVDVVTTPLPVTKPTKPTKPIRLTRLSKFSRLSDDSSEESRYTPEPVDSDNYDSGADYGSCGDDRAYGDERPYGESCDDRKAIVHSEDKSCTIESTLYSFSNKYGKRCSLVMDLAAIRTVARIYQSMGKTYTPKRYNDTYTLWVYIHDQIIVEDTDGYEIELEKGHRGEFELVFTKRGIVLERCCIVNE